MLLLAIERCSPNVDPTSRLQRMQDAPHLWVCANFAIGGRFIQDVNRFSKGITQRQLPRGQCSFVVIYGSKLIAHRPRQYHGTTIKLKKGMPFAMGLGLSQTSWSDRACDGAHMAAECEVVPTSAIHLV